MAVIGGGATGWFWDTIDRRIDEETTGGNIYRRKNWELIRYRRSNESYTDQSGEKLIQLTANNGAVDVVVSSPTTVGMSFLTIDFDSEVKLLVDDTSEYTYYNGSYYKTGTNNGAPYWLKTEGAADMYIYYNGSNVWKWDLGSIGGTNHMTATGAIDVDISTLVWTNTLGYTVPGTEWDSSLVQIASVGDAWVESGTIRNGKPVYVLFDVPDDYPWSDRQPVVWYSMGGTDRWVIGNVLNTELEADTFEDIVNSTNYPQGFAYGTVEEEDIEQTEFEGYTYWLGNSGITCELGDVNLPLTCLSDKQSYPNPFSDYYLRTQRWTYIEPYSLV